MPPHLNGDGTDEISDSTDFKEYIFNTKSSVKSHAFLLQAIRASNKKSILKFSEQLHAIRMRNKKYCGIFIAVVTIAVDIAIALQLFKSRVTSLPAYSHRRAALD